MSDRTPDSQDTSSEAIHIETVDQSRRKLTGAAIGASAIFTLASRPVLAGTACVTPSGHASATHLSHHGSLPTCTGKSPGYWKKEDRPWPSPYLPGSCSTFCLQPQNWTGGTLFHSVFMKPTNGQNAFLADLDNNPATPKTSLSMKQVLTMNDGGNPWGLTDQANLGAHIVAALLNAASGRTSVVLPEPKVIGMWTEWATKGYFTPTAGVKWYAADIVDYIVTTFTP